MTIVRLALAVPLFRYFDYSVPSELDPTLLMMGMRVLINFAGRVMVGIIIALPANSEVAPEKLKPLIALLDHEPILSPNLLKLCTFASDYYHHPLGEVIASALPKLLRTPPARTKRERWLAAGQRQWPSAVDSMSPLPTTVPPDFVRDALTLTSAQATIYQTLSEHLHQFKVFLLMGVTGSGKTEIYLQLIATVLAAGKQALVLVPEIGLTPQTVARFQHRFAVPIQVLHSELTDKQRFTAFSAAASSAPQIVIGTRSAVFASLPNLGLIIVDEEHDVSFTQQEGFRYSARDLAVLRGQHQTCLVVLGSATPSLESLHNVRIKRYQQVNLTERATAATLPTFRLVDLRGLNLRLGFAAETLATMQTHLTQGGQVLVFLNRRGYAPVLLCHQCSWIATCSHCDARLTYHANENNLWCHHCGRKTVVPTQCPSCTALALLPIGYGTERVEQALQQLFPQETIARVDSDSTARKGQLQQVLTQINDRDVNLLVGTQMLAKGHHFRDLTLVVVLNADAGLMGVDFRAAERFAQLLLQVAGRAGRESRAGEVLIQTHYPTHPLLQDLLAHDYLQVAERLLDERAATALPPYSYDALFRAEAQQDWQSLKWLMQLKNQIQACEVAGVTVLGPVPAIMQRRAGYFRGQLLLQSRQRAELHQVLKQVVPQLAAATKPKQAVRWTIDVDPADLY